jgi:hypothetical protein
MPGRSLLDALAENGALALKKVSGLTSSGTAGTRTNHAHGLRDHTGNKLTPSIIVCQVSATDVDHATTGLIDAGVAVVKVDADNVTVRCAAASQTFDLYVG